MRRLLNRRFVPFYFDMFGGFASDRDAARVVAKAKPALAGGSMGVNPVLFLTPDGKVVFETDVRVSAAQLLAILKRVLRAHPEYARPDPSEKDAALMERAEVLIDLGEYAAARKLLASLDTDEARYLAGHAARLEGQHDDMKALFAKLHKKALSDDVQVELAQAALAGRKFKEVARLAAPIEKGSRRYTEARYLLGLAQYHGGDANAARKTWKAAIEESKRQDPWIYRMDWAYAGPGGRSLIGRLGYYFENPELR